jgi:RNA polymerase sigma factor (sigma-70 family)
MDEPPTAGGGQVASVFSDVTARFTAIYEAKFSILVKVLQVMGASPEEAEDAAQDAMTDLFQRLKAGGEPPRTPEGWIITAAKRFFVKRRKRDRTRWMLEIKEFPPRDWVDGEMTALEEQQWAEQVLSHLTLAQRKVIRLVIAGASTSEIAEMLGMTKGNVRQHLMHGRNRLKARPGNSGKEESP